MYNEKNLYWILEKGVFDEGNPEKISSILYNKGVSFFWTNFLYKNQYIVDSHELSNISQNIKPLEDSLPPCVVVYGSLSLTRYIQSQYKWAPIAWLDEESLRCHKYYPFYNQLGFLAQDQYLFLPLCDIKTNIDLIYSNLGSMRNYGASRVFIRPDDNLKTFNGETVSYRMFNYWYNYITQYIDSTTFAVVCPPKTIYNEWRFVIVQNDDEENFVLTGSHYLGDDDDDKKKYLKARSKAQEISKYSYFSYPLVYCIDIAETEDDFKLLEIGSVNTSGLYDCSLDSLVYWINHLSLQQCQNC